jgi:hypothetical protein
MPADFHVHTLATSHIHRKGRPIARYFMTPTKTAFSWVTLGQRRYVYEERLGHGSRKWVYGMEPPRLVMIIDCE